MRTVLRKSQTGGTNSCQVDRQMDCIGE